MDSDGSMDDMSAHPVSSERTWQGQHRPPRTFAQSTKLQDVLYEIRGPVHEQASRLEAEGHRILKDRKSVV